MLKHVKLCSDRGFCMGYSVMLSSGNVTPARLRTHRVMALQDAKRAALAFQEEYDREACLRAYKDTYERYRRGDL